VAALPVQVLKQLPARLDQYRRVGSMLPIGLAPGRVTVLGKQHLAQAGLIGGNGECPDRAVKAVVKYSAHGVVAASEQWWGEAVLPCRQGKGRAIARGRW
jgi:hypothetical protein